MPALETIRLDVVWAARAARHIGWMAIDPGSVVRGIASVRVQGLNERQARWLLLELDDDLGDFVPEWREAYDERDGGRGTGVRRELRVPLRP